MILLGDCIEQLKTLPENSVDSIVTDPPYGLAFMGKKWDYDVPNIDTWKEALRVLKPGGHLLSFGGTRTYHRLAVAIEDAGFEIRDQLQWLFGSGFPKSLDISKAIDKMHGAEREEVGRSRDKKYSANGVTSGASIGGIQGGYNYRSEFDLTVPSTIEAKRWQGYGTALKPANEVIVCARKPLTDKDLILNLAQECQSKLFVQAVKSHLVSSQRELKEASNIAQWLAGKSILTQDALSEVTAMLQSESEKNSNLSIELSWLNILEEIYQNANTFTTGIASSLITDLKILSYLLSNNTQLSTLQNDGHGEQFNVSPVAKLLSALELKLSYIQGLSAQDHVTSKDALSNLRPNNEPIVLARKPLSESTVAKNVLKWGVGGLNIDGCRIETTDNLNGGTYSGEKRPSSRDSWGNGVGGGVLKNGIGREYVQPQGRFPANVLLDEDAAEMLDEMSGNLSKQGSRKLKDCPSQMFAGGSKDSTFYGDSGGASRFFYVAKASKRERNAGLEGMPLGQLSGLTGSGNPRNYMVQNHHPTVKPIKLMQYLIKLVTPQGGTVLDPFMGSGSTGVAAKSLGFEFIGCEMNEEYIAIAEKRIANAQ